MAQPGSARPLGGRGPGFESRRPDRQLSVEEAVAAIYLADAGSTAWAEWYRLLAEMGVAAAVRRLLLPDKLLCSLDQLGGGLACVGEAGLGDERGGVGGFVASLA